MFGLAGASVAAEKPTSRRGRTAKGARPHALDARADVNAAQVDGMTALHWAVYNDDADTAGRLVDRAPTSTPPIATAPPLPRLHKRKRGPRELLLSRRHANASLPGGETSS
jgi:hypothetical protein